MPIPTNTYLEKVHISAIKAGDTIFHNERLMTVCRRDIKVSTLMGCSIFGDSYHSGYKPFVKVHFLVPKLR